MIHRVLRIGNSLGVIITKKEAARLNIKVGDKIEVVIRKSTARLDKRVQLLNDLEIFMKRYDQDLKKLR